MLMQVCIGIAVSSTPVAVNNATADVGIFLMIGALRQAYVPLAAIRAGVSHDGRFKTVSNLDYAGQWQGETKLGHDPNGKTLGILGMGGIGRVSIEQWDRHRERGADTHRKWLVEPEHSA